MRPETIQDIWSFYPKGWPKCWWCSRPRLDGHLTCGVSLCSEAAARDAALRLDALDREIEEALAGQEDEEFDPDADAD